MPNGKCYAIDMLGFYLYETSKLTIIIDFHPTHNIEGFKFLQYSSMQCLF